MKKIRLAQKITSRESESFRRYLDEVREIEKFTVDEEFETALRAIDKNLSEKERENASQELITRNLRFVISVAKQFISQENSLEDLVNEGNHGLIYAARRFDPTKGFKFITYAVWWIRRDILSFINKNARIVRLPSNKLALLSKLKEEIATIEQFIERTPTLEDILQYTKEGDYDSDDIKFFIQSERENSYSFDQPVQDEDSQALMSDLYADDTFGPTDQHLIEDDGDYNVNKLLANLKNDDERKVLTYLFGLNGKEKLTPKEVAKILDLSRERIRQIKVNSLKRLKDLLKS